MTSIEFQFKQFSGPKEYLPAMHKAIDIAKNNNFTSGDGFATVWSKIFATWVTDEVCIFIKIDLKELIIFFEVNRY